MKKSLRNYQQDACKALHKSMVQKQYGYASVMTGLGKSLVLAALANRYVNQDARVLILAPRKELIEQNYLEAYQYMDKPHTLGIVCGMLKLKQLHKQCVIAMPSSFVGSRTVAGRFDYCLIDECHHVSVKKPGVEGVFTKGTYHKIIDSLLRINPEMKVCGLTATPYRLDQGELHEESHKIKPFFTDKVYDTSENPGISSFIKEGYLSHIETLNNNVNVDLTGVKMSGKDYSQQEAGVKFDAIIDEAVPDMRQHFERNGIKTALIFTSNITNAQHILRSWGDSSTMRIVCADESICTKQQRNDAIEWLKNGSGCRYVVNVDILAEGFDMKHLQCCVLLRATTSPGLMVQMIGRILRPHDDKEQSYLIDYGTNCERLGNIDNIIVPKVKSRPGDAPKKVCLICNTVNLLSAKKCKECGAEFISENEDGNYTMRTKAQALQGKEAKKMASRRYEVDQVLWETHISKKGDDMLKALMYFENELVHTQYYPPAMGHILRSIFINTSDYYKVCARGYASKYMISLMNDYPGFFKKITAVWLSPNGNFKQLDKWELE